jgi:hypothetical protein
MVADCQFGLANSLICAADQRRSVLSPGYPGWPEERRTGPVSLPDRMKLVRRAVDVLREELCPDPPGASEERLRFRLATQVHVVDLGGRGSRRAPEGKPSRCSALMRVHLMEPWRRQRGGLVGRVDG